jgi:phage shock protein PspC (stress-responsive transcriptional regulator)
MATYSDRQLVRTDDNKVIAGVCGAIARRYGWSATTVRLLFLLSFLLPGPQIVIYLILWVVIPKQ